MTDTRKEFEQFVLDNMRTDAPNFINERRFAEKSWQACQSLNDKRIADMLAVIAKQKEYIKEIKDITLCTMTESIAEEALAITPESVELVEFACTIENGVNNNINDYALYKREDAEMHCRGECDYGFRIVPLYTIKQKG